MSPTSVHTLDLTRRVPPIGGFNLTFLGLEIRRMLRNRRTVIFTLIMPVVFYVAFGYSQRGQSLGNANAAAYVMVSLACYGALVATVSGAAMVSVERAQGWSRQLRLTPLRPLAYIATKTLTAMVLGLFAVLAVYIVGAATGVALAMSAWILSGLAAWLCAFVFAALGLFVGYLIPSENVMQIMGAGVGLLALAGGLFVPVSVWGPGFQAWARFTPAYGVGEIARAPLHADAFDWVAVPNIIIWTILFAVGATLLFRRDTKRV
ncbi:MAG: ABC transporter permease [Pseudonocardiaceae bacterium]